ncbi:MAG: hypothetical protein AAF726_10140 [Planctomycetota bacterium]
MLLLLAGCGPSEAAAADAGEPQGDHPAAIAEAVAVPSAMCEVRCGRRIPGVGKCGNDLALGGERPEVENRETSDLGVTERCAVTRTVAASVTARRSS